MKTLNLAKTSIAVWRYSAIRIGIAAICLCPLLAGVSVMLCGEYEAAQGTLIPRYLWDDDELIKKHLYTLAPDLEFLADRYGASEFEDMASLRACPRVLSAMVAQVHDNSLNLRGRMPATRDLGDYKNTLDPAMLVVADKVVRDLFVPFLKKKYSAMAEELLATINSNHDVPFWMTDMYPDEGDRMAMLDSLASVAMAILNHDLAGAYGRYEEVPVPAQVIRRDPRWIEQDSPEWLLWGDFVRGLPGQYKWMPTLEVYWRSYLRDIYSGRVTTLNEVWGSKYAAFSLIPVPEMVSESEAVESDWSKFVLRAWPRSMLELPSGYDDTWREYLQSRYAGAGEMLDGILHGVEEDAKRAIELPLRRPSDGGMDLLWCDFVESGAIPARQIRLVTHTGEFGPYLRSNYLGGRIISLNDEWHTSFESFADVPLPLGLSDLSLFLDDAKVLRGEYASAAWFTAMRHLEYPPEIVTRTVSTVVVLAFMSLLLSAVTAYVLARLPLRGSLKWAGICLAGSLVPASCYVGVAGYALPEVLRMSYMLTGALLGLNLISIMIFRRWFLGLIKQFREIAVMDGVGELGFIFRVILRYSWPVTVYMAVIHFLCVYCFVDWQILLTGRLWDWTLGVWAIDQCSAGPPVKAAIALLGLLPVFFLVSVCYPVLTRYCLVPVLSSCGRDDRVA